MKAQRHNGRGSLVLAVSLPGVLKTRRIRKATGTNDRREFERVAAWVMDLYDQGQLDSLREMLADKSATPVEHWRRYARGFAPVNGNEQQPPLLDLLQLWLDAVRLSPLTQRDRRYWLQPDETETRRMGKLLRLLPKEPPPPLSALIAPLSALRQRKVSGTASRAEYLRARAAVMAFYRDLPQLEHPLISDGLAAELHAKAASLRLGKGKGRPLKTREHQPFTPEAARALAAKMGRPHGLHLWALFTSGLNPREYFGEDLKALDLFPGNVLPDDLGPVWEIKNEYTLQVCGTKREARKRVLPLIWPDLYYPTSSYSVFVKAFRGVQEDTPADGRYQPYDLRRGFAVSCVLAGLTRSRRLQYMGHQPPDVLDVYEKEALNATQIKKDCRTLRRFFGKAPKID